MLIEAGANPNSRELHVGALLCCAAQRGHLAAVKVLLRAKKADPLLTLSAPSIGAKTCPSRHGVGSRALGGSGRAVTEVWDQGMWWCKWCSCSQSGCRELPRGHHADADQRRGGRYRYSPANGDSHP